MKASEIIKAHCNNCRGDRNQKIISSHLEEGLLHDDIKYGTYHCITQCLGCDSIYFLANHFTYQQGEDIDPDHSFILTYPEPILGEDATFLTYDDRRYFPTTINNLYEEIYNAFKSESLILSGIGLRTILEAVCNHQDIQGDNLQEKILALHSSDFISKNEIPILDKLRLIGNVSAHKIKSLPTSQLEYALDIVNHLLKTVYVLPAINKKIKI